MGLKVWHMVLESAWGPYCRKAVYIYIYIYKYKYANGTVSDAVNVNGVLGLTCPL